MKVLFKVSAAIVLLFSLISCNAHLKNVKTEKVKIYGNCEKCEKTIETAGNIKKVANVDWNKDSKMATISYDSTKTNQEEILKRIALAGYDSDKFLAPDEVYSKLPECCKYDRVNKTVAPPTTVNEDNFTQTEETVIETEEEVKQLITIFEKYFSLKDALVKSDGKLASSIAKEMLDEINAVKMDKLSTEEHVVWMKVMNNLKANTEKISVTTNLEKQRKAFMGLSSNMYDLIKVSKQEYKVYYQNCPMYNDGKGANWLSKENAIKNPYYGSQMLTCGKTIETID